MKKLFYILIFLVLAYSAKAVVAYPHPIDIIQNDGTTLTILLHGNEWNHFTTTIDGYKIEEKEQGLFYYRHSNIKANNPKFRSAVELAYLENIKLDLSIDEFDKISKVSQAPAENQLYTSFPREGSPKSIVILVNYSDTVFVTPNANDAFTRLLNEVGYSDNGATGSTVDYFKSSSYGKFSPDFDVAGPFNLPNPMSYYGLNDTNGNDTLPTNLIVDACRAADLAGVDFSKYDLNNDGYIDNVFVYYAGRNEAEGGGKNTIWPHRWSVVPGENYNGTTQSIRFDGKKLNSYACTSELKGSTGSQMCGIGTFTHEFGHVLGMVDYYHTASSVYKKTLEYWSIMDIGVYLNGGRTPPVYSSYDRFYLGWLTPQEINQPATLILNPLSQTTSTETDGQAYLFSTELHNLDGLNPTPNEFYLVEYRKKVGWDAYLKDEGMLIWHIDYNQEAWDANGPNNYTGETQTEESHMRVYLQPLSGNTSTPGAPFKSGGFTPISWLGDTLDRKISAIEMNSQNIHFDFMGGIPDPEFTAGIIVNQIKFTRSRVGVSRTKNFQLQGDNYSEDLTISIEGTDAIQFGSSTSTIDKSVLLHGVNLSITYLPTSSGSHTATLKMSSGTWEKTYRLTGFCD